MTFLATKIASCGVSGWANSDKRLHPMDNVYGDGAVYLGMVFLNRYLMGWGDTHALLANGKGIGEQQQLQTEKWKLSLHVKNVSVKSWKTIFEVRDEMYIWTKIMPSIRKGHFTVIERWSSAVFFYLILSLFLSDWSYFTEVSHEVPMMDRQQIRETSVSYMLTTELLRKCISKYNI